MGFNSSKSYSIPSNLIARLQYRISVVHTEYIAVVYNKLQTRINLQNGRYNVNISNVFNED